MKSREEVSFVLSISKKSGWNIKSFAKCTSDWISQLASVLGIKNGHNNKYSNIYVVSEGLSNSFPAEYPNKKWIKKSVLRQTFYFHPECNNLIYELSGEEPFKCFNAKTVSPFFSQYI